MMCVRVGLKEENVDLYACLFDLFDGVGKNLVPAFIIGLLHSEGHGHVEHFGHVSRGKLDKLGQKLKRKVLNRVISEILEGAKSLGFTGTRQASDRLSGFVSY